MIPKKARRFLDNGGLVLRYKTITRNRYTKNPAIAGHNQLLLNEKDILSITIVIVQKYGRMVLG